MKALPAIEAKNLSRWYGDVIAVNDVTVDVESGITGLLGPNGAGKSTFMRIAMGLLRPSSGSIQVLGEKPWNNTRLVARLGYVGEGDAPWRDQSGYDCAVFAGRLAGLEPKVAQDAAETWLRRLGLEGVRDRKVDHYSRGMRQRLKFALAMLHEPELLVLDEPLMGTDPPTRHDIIELIRDLERQGRSILVSTHVLPDIEAMTQRIMLFNHGRLMAYGDVPRIREVLEQYPRTVRIGTSRPRDMGAALWPWPTVLNIEAEEEAVVVRTREPARFWSELQDFLASTSLPFDSVTSPDDDVAAIFRYLVRA